jgi:hypothetical protein
MKKFILIATVCLLATVATYSQRAVTIPIAAGDTIVNTATVNKSLPQLTGTYSAAAVQIVFTKISGTVAGTTKLQGSLNGTNWEDIGSAFTHTDVASQAKLFTVTGGVPYQYFRTTSTGSGTMSAKILVTYLYRL